MIAMSANNNKDGLAEAMACARTLIDALKTTPAVRHFLAAEPRFRSDPQVQALLTALKRKAEGFRRDQEAGTLRQEQLEELREMQAKFQSHPAVQNLNDAREGVGLLFQETNRFISEILGFDFGQTAGRSGGAC
jgi:cell fate (sporulation/competence/biofilm development) regulator YlbF (YheA/YmcA/DUF963 family)